MYLLKELVIFMYVCSAVICSQTWENATLSKFSTYVMSVYGQMGKSEKTAKIFCSTE